MINSEEYEDSTDTLFIGDGLHFEKPYRIEYEKTEKGLLDEGKIFFGDSILYSFQLEINLVNDSINPDKWFIQDTVITTFRKDTMIFNWYRKNGFDWITAKYIYTHAFNTKRQYSIWGYSKYGEEFKDELSFLYSEIRRIELVDFFDHDSTLIRNIVEAK